MEELTRAQADFLRSIRKQAGFLNTTADGLMGKMANFVCPHEVEGDTNSEHMPDTCGVCACYAFSTDILQQTGDLCELIDVLLLRGPTP